EIGKVLAWAEPQGIPVIALAGSTHFFHGKLIVLRDTISRFAPMILG
ncbi:alpha/beta hydrolase, partial [Neisseria iguanae]